MGRFPLEETLTASINIQLVGIGLARSVDSEHGTGMDLIKLAPSTHPMSYVGCNIMLVMYERMNITSPFMCK
jgi:hypothetical protein